MINSKLAFLIIVGCLPTTFASANSDYTWVKALKGKYSFDFVSDPRAKSLVSSTVGTKSCENKNIQEELWQSLGGPGEPIQISEGRFATIHGCRKHACHEISMIWIDAEQSKAVAAFVSLRGGPVYIASKDYSVRGLPREFTLSLKAWLDTINWNGNRPTARFCSSAVSADL